MADKKKQLYRAIRRLKIMQGLSPDDYGLNVVQHVKDLGVLVEMLDYKTSGFRGIAIPGRDFEKDTILLNQSRSSHEINFDCAYEMVHLSFHGAKRRSPFVCSEEALPHQDAFLEWQAYEGAAEYCIPYTVFLVVVKTRYKELKNGGDQETKFFCDKMADFFLVPPQIIKERLESLRYEIYQYCEKGVPLEDIEVLSDENQKERGIVVSSRFHGSIEDPLVYYYKIIDLPY